MPLHIKSRSKTEDQHSADVNTLVYQNGKLYSGADDGKIIVNEAALYYFHPFLLQQFDSVGVG